MRPNLYATAAFEPLASANAARAGAAISDDAANAITVGASPTARTMLSRSGSLTTSIITVSEVRQPDWKVEAAKVLRRKTAEQMSSSADAHT